MEDEEKQEVLEKWAEDMRELEPSGRTVNMIGVKNGREFPILKVFIAFDPSLTEAARHDFTTGLSQALADGL